uniref:Putative secreted protein synganglion overexpressed n=1 Tax=Rhipicephalus microplus TaxID=6941 RepID=A0A6M2DBD6_RHIMP
MFCFFFFFFWLIQLRAAYPLQRPRPQSIIIVCLRTDEQLYERTHGRTHGRTIRPTHHHSHHGYAVIFF